MTITRARAHARLGTLGVVAALTMTLLVVMPGGSAEAATGGPAPVEQRSDKVVTADPLPTVQIDAGIVWAQAMAGDIVFAGGAFENARPAGAAPGVGLMPRSNILAFDINTGVATPFAPRINGTVKALAVSPDKRTLYVGGSFTKVDDQTRFNVAAFDIATGALLPFRPAIGGSYVNAIAVTDSTVYVGGLIGAATGVTRKNLAAVSTSGALLGWAPTTDLQVDAMTLTPARDRLIVGGRFTQVNGAAQKGQAALDLTSGASLPWQAAAKIQNGTSKGGIWSLTTDADAVYGTAWSFGGGNLEGAFSADPTSGALRWVADCHGDHYGIYSDGTTVYTTNHAHDCSTVGGFPQKNPAPGNQRNATAYTAATKGTLGTSVGGAGNWAGNPAPALVNWFPDWTTGTASGSGQAGWTITGNGRYISVGGEFPFVNSKRHQGLVRFSVAPEGGAKQAPRLSGDTWQPIGAGGAVPGGVRVGIPTNWDRDDSDLRYELWEVGGSAPLDVVNKRSFYWNAGSLYLFGTGFEPSSSHTFVVIARDGDGNTAQSAPVTVVAGAGKPSAYANGILADHPYLYWRLDRTDDTAGLNTGGIALSERPKVESQVDPDDGALGVNNRGWVASKQTFVGPQEFSAEVWFKTATTQGGKLIGFGDKDGSNSSRNDRNLYMLNDGRLTFGVYPGQIKAITSPASYNDDKWHHAVASLSPTGGLSLHVDGKKVAADPQVTSAEAFSGYWRVGGDAMGGWPGTWSSSLFTGALDEFAVYNAPLTDAQIAAHYALGNRDGSAPLARVTSQATGLRATLDGSTSTAASGRKLIQHWWDFGDGQTGLGATTEHAYAKPGTYTVTLTVSDDRGKLSTTTTRVTVTHAAPSASIDWSAADLTASFGAGKTVYADGAQGSSFAWDFGDGTTSTEAAPTHTYAAAGTYTASLRVTDSLGATSALVSVPVTVVGAAAAPIDQTKAKDAFSRDSASGWGAAETGGRWSGTTGFSVADGTGRIAVGAGQTRTTLLSEPAVTDSEAWARLALDRVADGGGAHVNYLVRKTAGGDYRVKIRVTATGAVTVSVAKVVGTTETLLSSKTLPGVVYTAGMRLNLHTDVSTQGGRTTVAASVWPDGATEPASWLVSATDGQPELAGPGQVGVSVYVSGSTTGGPLGIGFDDFEVR